ncbi:MAG: FIST N-terminal domain-containing protein [Myxococcota bacterium]
MTTIATANAEGNAARATARIESSLDAQLGGAEPVLVMAFASTAQSLPDVAAALTKRYPSACVIGSSTAGEFTEMLRNQKGTVSAIAIAGDFQVRAGIGRGLRTDPEAAVTEALKDSALPESETHPHRTALLLLDPLAGKSEIVTLLAGTLLGDVPLAGGAAGDDLAMKETFVSCGDACASDAVVICQIASTKPLGLGVSHGHEPLSVELEVTAAEGALVKTVEGRPAWDVWMEYTREAAKKVGLDPDSLTDDDVIAYLLRFEAGLANGTQYKIRAPLARGDDGSLTFACAIPTGATFRITESEPVRQVASAVEAAERAVKQLGGAKPAGAVVFDCICRNLILGERFGDAVDGITKALGGAPIAGFETYGEIALMAGDMSGFHNTTTVVLAFPE